MTTSAMLALLCIGTVLVYAGIGVVVIRMFIR
jgi:hypothetical protein